MVKTQHFQRGAGVGGCLALVPELRSHKLLSTTKKKKKFLIEKVNKHFNR